MSDGSKNILKTWHYEIAVVGIILCTVTWLLANNLVNWIATAAILLTFNHGQIGDRLQERQARMIKPSVHCYKKLNILFAGKELLWITVFVLAGTYSAIVGSLLFALYPFWRKYYRKHIKPLQSHQSL